MSVDRTTLFDDEVEAPTLRGLWTLAFPMIVSQASETMMLFVDRLFLSSLGKAHIAASMSGGLSSFVFSSFFAGIVGYTNAMVAQYYGAKQRQNCVRVTNQGIFLSIAFLPLLIALIPLVQASFVWVGHTPRQIALESSYFRILMAGTGFVLLRQTLAGYFLGSGKTRVVMIANVVGMTVNIPLNYVLIFGAFGFPALGIQGAAYGTVAGSGVIFLILFVAYLRSALYKATHWREAWKFRPALMRRLIRFGLPAGTELFLNVFAFNIFVQFFHSMGEDVAAAVTITFNYDMVAFIPMLGLGVAVTAMVGQQVGAGHPDRAREATFLALKVGYSYAFAMMLLFVFGANPLVQLFAGGMESTDSDLLFLARTMVRLAAIYTLADITQLVFAGALRGAGDTKWLMVFSVAIHWLMAIVSVMLIRVFALGPLIVWAFFIAFVMALGVTIFLRFQSGHWRSIEMIERETIEEIHPPEIKIESQWM